VSEAWVINAPPLILFARIGRLDLFEQLASKIIIPSAVFDEVRIGQEKDGTAAIALAWSAETPDLVVPAVSSIGTWEPVNDRSSRTGLLVPAGSCLTTLRRGAVPRPMGYRSSDRSVLFYVPNRAG
jgi:hypothetical protein